MAPRPNIVDGLIIGAGPAGLTAALAFARTRATAIVFDSSSYRNEGITHMHAVPSRDHIDPYEFRRISREQIETRYETIWFQNATITQAAKKPIGDGEKYDGFEVTDSAGQTYRGKKLILATGSRDVFPDIPGYAENWPRHIYQCLACDGFEQRGTPIGILEFSSPMHAHYVAMALNFDPRVTVFSNGPISSAAPVQQALKVAKALGAKVDERKIVRLVNNGPSHVEGVSIEFETGEPVTLGFIAHRPPTVNRAQDLVEQLGLETVDPAMGGHVKIVDPMFNKTSVKGVFAAGDTMSMMKQVTVSMADGLKAAAGVGNHLGAEKSAAALKAWEEKEAKA
ncbi:FAD/NAD(P)-binding domain-containing protein [Trematosphaeria pertusa]|uniref:FAD/NAD(P)-binding domain-containing protein n=1 Tax=Trematosphaeria pertusa TaxID=390896 RepID=A0A6A6J096_9PLEO|nr:FAD/NAD(P)-binding domain-containing protein [Trematosphaeria pertusa]KAF2256046.1 FAD/NAD(P)-binding domain-containing protein [Trematosphaeria pertusa]